MASNFNDNWVDIDTYLSQHEGVSIKDVVRSEKDGKL
jgi:hypothetical protein